MNANMIVSNIAGKNQVAKHSIYCLPVKIGGTFITFFLVLMRLKIYIVTMTPLSLVTLLSLRVLKWQSAILGLD